MRQNVSELILNVYPPMSRMLVCLNSPAPRHHRQVEAEIPLMLVFEFGQSPLSSGTFNIIGLFDAGIGQLTRGAHAFCSDARDADARQRVISAVDSALNREVIEKSKALSIMP